MAINQHRLSSEARHIGEVEANATDAIRPIPATPGLLARLPVPAGYENVECPARDRYVSERCFERHRPLQAGEPRDAYTAVFERLFRAERLTVSGMSPRCVTPRDQPGSYWTWYVYCQDYASIGADRAIFSLSSMSYRAGARRRAGLPAGVLVRTIAFG